MKDALLKIKAYNQLINKIESLRQEVFSYDNSEHLNYLHKLWHGLKGDDDKLSSNITKRWGEIGFQGTLIFYVRLEKI
jgi:hypothetical protein